MKLTIKVISNAKKSEIIERGEDFLKVKLRAQRVKGKANRELIRLLADEFSVPQTAIEIIRGEYASIKTVEIC